MRFSHLLPLAALGGALVLPDEQVVRDLAIEPRKSADSWLDKLPTKSELVQDIEEAFDLVKDTSKNVLDEAFELATDAASSLNAMTQEAAYDVSSWMSQELHESPDLDILGGGDDHPPHRDPPHRDPPHHGPPHRGPPGHDHKPNMTIYQLITESKYTTKLAELIKEDKELVRVLNGTKANYTVFAPTDRAFEKIPKHGKKPPKELIKETLLYHISPDFYPAGRILVSRTIPTLHKEAALGHEPRPQRLSTNLGLRGLTVNFYSRVVAVNVFGTNGVIHGIDSVLFLPPKTLEVVDLAPGFFSTLELGLAKTGLLEKLNTTKHAGGTLFAPSNFAFQKLGPRINAFLFSPAGRKYLTALLQYHVVANQTLYSDAFYKADSLDAVDDHHHGDDDDHKHHDRPGHGVPKGYFRVELPTLLEDKTLDVYIARYGRFISIKINGFVRVTGEDVIAKDGVIQVVSDVLIPPKKLGDFAVTPEDLTVEELMERLEPLVVEPKMDL